MTSISLPIIGPGSQPHDPDGTELAYLAMPESMSIYRMPELQGQLPTAALDLLQQVKQQLQDFPKPAPPIAVIGFDEAIRTAIDEVLGEGEVSIVVNDKDSAFAIQETILAGVWRVKQFAGGQQLLNDTLEIGFVPACISQLGFTEAASQISLPSPPLPPGVMNALPLLTEINAHIGQVPSLEAHVINLSLLPHTEADLALLQNVLGPGKVTLLSRGYGNCRITSTATQNVWWVQFFNSQDVLILNTLEITAMPGVACAAPEDIADSLERLSQIIEVYA